jgi:hypothetical protein
MFLKNIQQDIQIENHSLSAYKDPNHTVNVRIPGRQARRKLGEQAEAPFSLHDEDA